MGIKGNNMIRCRLYETSAFIIIIGLFAIFFAFIISPATAYDAPEEQWSHTYGGIDDDYFESVAAVSDGYVFAGWILSQDTDSFDGFVVKFDASGNELWSKAYVGNGYERFNSIVTCSDGYVLAGYSNGGAWGMKVDTNGNELWNNEYSRGGDFFKSVAVCQDGGYVLAGHSSSLNAGMTDGLVVKIDADGNEQWSHTFGGTDVDYFESVAAVTDGYVLAGVTKSQGAGSYDGWVVKLDTSGNEQWDKTFGDTSYDSFMSVIALQDGGCILIGNMNVPDVGLDDGWLVKLDSAGNELWSQTYGGTNMEAFYSADICPDDGYIIAGATMQSSAGGFDGWLVKVDADGNEQWDGTYGGTEYDFFSSVDVCPDGGYAMQGTRSPGVRENTTAGP